MRRGLVHAPTALRGRAISARAAADAAIGAAAALATYAREGSGVLPADLAEARQLVLFAPGKWSGDDGELVYDTSGRWCTFTV